MIKLITLDKDNNVAFMEEYPKRYRPKFGFYREKNGDFVKKLSDPRCISDADKRAALKVKDICNKPKTYDFPLVKRTTQELEQVNNYSTSNCKTILRQGRLVKVSSILDCLESYRIGSCTFDHFELENVNKFKKCEIDVLNHRTNFAKIIFKSSSKVILVWFDDPHSDKPDLGIVSGVIWD